MVTIVVPREGVPAALVVAVLDGMIAEVTAGLPHPVLMGGAVVAASDVVAWLRGVRAAAEEGIDGA